MERRGAQGRAGWVLCCVHLFVSAGGPAAGCTFRVRCTCSDVSAVIGDKCPWVGWDMGWKGGGWSVEEGWEGGGYSGWRREVGGGVRGEVVL